MVPEFINEISFIDCGRVFIIRFVYCDHMIDGVFSIGDRYIAPYYVTVGHSKTSLHMLLQKTTGDLKVEANSDTMPQVIEMLKQVLK